MIEPIYIAVLIQLIQQYKKMVSCGKYAENIPIFDGDDTSDISRLTDCNYPENIPYGIFNLFHSISISLRRQLLKLTQST